MRTAIKTAVAVLVGFTGNLIPTVVPERAVTTVDLLWASVTAVVVGLIVLGVTHERIWREWAFELRWPFRRTRPGTVDIQIFTGSPNDPSPHFTTTAEVIEALGGTDGIVALRTKPGSGGTGGIATGAGAAAGGGGGGGGAGAAGGPGGSVGLPLSIPASPLLIALADPPDPRSEAHLEWPHVAVGNMSATRLLSVRAEVLVTGRSGASGTVLRLRWSPNFDEMVALEPHETRTVSLCVRSREPDKEVWTGPRGIAVHPAQWVCYVTDEAFLLSRTNWTQLAVGDSDLRVRVIYGESGSAEAWFRVYVPSVPGKPMWVVPLPATRDAR